ncbi:uncharacterized protein METZ01_LOCUS475526 [marine metagenome]|uniref:Uncharacterized protein n=1 Tax=marine metagenome TaxID=408172 RepID=A0A383BRY6_9ZZZZ
MFCKGRTEMRVLMTRWTFSCVDM